MKRLLTLAIIATIGIQANGATINWGAAKSYFGTSSLGSKATGYLIYLGSAGVTWADTTVDYKAIADGTSEKYLSTKTSSTGKVSGQVSATEDVTPVYSGAETIITDGDSVFGVMLTFVNNDDGKTYYHLGGTFLFDTTSTTYTAANKTFTWTDSAVASNSDVASQGWVAVPEPSSAALALAGLALLLKRRKA